MILPTENNSFPKEVLQIKVTAQRSKYAERLYCNECKIDNAIGMSENY